MKQKEDLGKFLERTRRYAVALNNKLKRFMELFKDPESTKLLLKSLRTEFGRDETPTDAAIKEYLHKLQRSLTILFVTLRQLREEVRKDEAQSRAKNQEAEENLGPDPEAIRQSGPGQA